MRVTVVCILSSQPASTSGVDEALRDVIVSSYGSDELKSSERVRKDSARASNGGGSGGGEGGGIGTEMASARV